jgi:hypothetical protein
MKRSLMLLPAVLMLFSCSESDVLTVSDEFCFHGAYDGSHARMQMEQWRLRRNALRQIPPIPAERLVRPFQPSKPPPPASPAIPAPAWLPEQFEMTGAVFGMGFGVGRGRC